MSNKNEIITVKIEKEWKERLRRIVRLLARRYPEGNFSMASISEAAIKKRIIELEKELGVYDEKGEDNEDSV